MTMQEHPDLRQSRRIREYFDLVSLTAKYRHGITWHGARELMASRGHDPMSTFLMSCDDGDDLNARFVLPDGSAVSCDFRDDPKTRQAVFFTRWSVMERSDDDEEDEYTLAAEILQDAELKAAFDHAVQAFFEFHWRRMDRPLPPSET
ncbi:hypothetical protein [Roseimicrobium sp. ORNL1]|uniref:hypothetical protein n=1 Tax=Roseimicrobium sp. ORNL1 TaxID=2711231 RepID=UPI001980F986|nr:hypothetical protein [Roseimicrobium sp. ORNL1]